MTEQTLLRGQRRELPNPRRTVRWHLWINGQGVYVDAGMYASGEVGELFIDIAKEGTALRTAMDQWSKAVSYMIQWGVPLERIIKSARWTHCEPCGPVSGHPDVVTCTSIYDAVAQLLAIEFLHDWERVKHKHWYTTDPSPPDVSQPCPLCKTPCRPGPAADTWICPKCCGEKVADRAADQSTVETPVGLVYNTGEVTVQDAPASPVDLVGAVLLPTEERSTLLPPKNLLHHQMVAQARQCGYEGNPCKQCGRMKLVRKGACLYCLACNESEGCS